MKYLKRYKLFENDTNHYELPLDNILDILVDVKDLGFDVTLLKDPNGTYTDPSIEWPVWLDDFEEQVEAVRIFIEHNPQEYSKTIFKFGDIKGNIDHLMRYMKQEFDYDKFYYIDKYTEFNLIEGKTNTLPDDDDIVGVITLIFYKYI